MSYLPLISVCSAALSDKGLAGKQLEAAHWHDLLVSFSHHTVPTESNPEPFREHRHRKWLPSRYCQAYSKQNKHAVRWHRWKAASLLFCSDTEVVTRGDQRLLAEWSLLVYSQLANRELYSFKCV